MTEGWPDLSRSGTWPATQDYLHLLVQMLGKLRIGLAAALPEWGHTPLALSARGLRTGALPVGGDSVDASLDLFDHVIRVETSTGHQRAISVAPARAIADVWAEYRAALDDLGVRVELWDKPQERPDVTPFSADHRPREYDPAAGLSFFRLLTDVQPIFDEWRSPFWGRSIAGFWWGGFDIAAMVYNGRRAVPRPGADYLKRYDLDAEHLLVGFWPGTNKWDPMFYGYIVPEPAGAPGYPLAAPAGWMTAFREWILPYEAVRLSLDPLALVRGFFGELYRAAHDLAGWDRDAFTYARPPRPSPAAAMALGSGGQLGRDGSQLEQLPEPQDA